MAMCQRVGVMEFRLWTTGMHTQRYYYLSRHVTCIAGLTNSAQWIDRARARAGSRL